MIILTNLNFRYIYIVHADSRLAGVSKKHTSIAMTLSILFNIVSSVAVYTGLMYNPEFPRDLELIYGTYHNLLEFDFEPQKNLDPDS